MPRFTDQEKEMIRVKLLAEGEKLFAVYGLKKVTVDDLVAAVNISKGSFYAFYPSKEHLYIEINFRLQDKLFHDIKKAISNMQFTDHKALAKEVIMRGLNEMVSSPILSQFDFAIIDYLQRKLPVELFDNHNQTDIQILEILESRGVQFAMPHAIVIKSLYAVLACLEQYKSDDDLPKIQKLLVDGIIEQSVK